MHLERHALDAIRAFDRGDASVADTIEAVVSYAGCLDYDLEPLARSKKLSLLKDRYLDTLTKKPWKQCDCVICASISVEVIIFRSSNRNKRRGIHNLEIFGRHVRQLKERTSHA